jgi:hypothetical protein
VEKARAAREPKEVEDSPMPDADVGEGEDGNSGENADALSKDEDMSMKDAVTPPKTETPVSSQPLDVEMDSAEQVKSEEAVSQQ